MDLLLSYTSVESIAFTCLFVLAINQINKIRFKKLSSDSLFSLENNLTMQWFYFIIVFWNLLNVIYCIKIPIIQKLVQAYLIYIYTLIGWIQCSLFTPIIIYLIINTMDLLWSKFLNNIENFKTTEEKFAECYRIRWTDRLTILVFILFPMIDIYGYNYLSIKKYHPNLAVLLNPYFKHCHYLSNCWPNAGLFIIPPIVRRLRRHRGVDTKQYSSSRLEGASLSLKDSLLPKRTIFSTFKSFKYYYEVSPQYFVRWNSACILLIWATNRLYNQIIKAVLTGKSPFLKIEALVTFFETIVSPIFYWCILSILFYVVFSSLQGECAVFPTFINVRIRHRVGKYRSLFKKEEDKQTKFIFLKFLVAYIIFYVCDLQGIFVSLFNPFFLLDVNYLTVAVDKI